jgi:predicted ABC-class ATPase
MPGHPGLVPFISPPSLSVEVALPHRGVVRGMGIRRGITLIAGGGFHGKSTLLQALEAGVYNKVR